MRAKFLFVNFVFCAFSSAGLFAAHDRILNDSALKEAEQAMDWGFFDLNANRSEAKISQKGLQKKSGNFYLPEYHHHSSPSSPSSNDHDSVILFKADTSECRIGLNDRALIETGQADFVTAFNGNDFQCSVIKVKHHGSPHCTKALQILPLNGSSFTFGVPPLGTDGPTIGGLFDHVKFLAYSVNTTAPEFEGELCSRWVGSGAQLNVDLQPFGNAVKNPDEDCRLACFNFVSIDTDLLLTFDWICTNDIIYALAERLPLLGTDYAAYTYLIPVYKRKPGVNPLKDVHQFETCYNRSKGTMTWILDGHPVFAINQFGVRLTKKNAFVFDKNGKKVGLKNPSRLKILDHGGADQLVTPINLQSGISFFTLLDAYRPNNIKGKDNAKTQGLVRLESSEFRFPGIFYYNNPLTFDITSGGPAATFVQDSPLDITGLQHTPTIPWQFRLFGQGAELRLFSYDVSIRL